ncbi:MAG TPA: dTDP-glucose 4,6-dehydratase [Dongiaceae bacterium]|nr:dTDP-glucose 4,6-dehydratase [Dongiaceae bacterium]
MESLLITGGAGFIGANFVRYWHQKYPKHRVVVLDALTYAGNRASLLDLIESNAIHFIHGDIRDQALVEQLLRQHDIGWIVNFAAESHVDRSIAGPDAFIETNVVGTHALLKAARQVWLVEQGGRPGHRFHHISTDEVFGSLGPGDASFTENRPYQPNSPYAASKAASDHLVRAYHHTYGLAVTTSNCSNNYGPYHFPEKLIPLCICRLLLGQTLPVYGDGRNVRDWLHVEDHCRGIEQVLLLGTAGETYNIGTHNECDNLTLVQRLCELMDQAFRDDPVLAQQYPACPAARGEPSTSAIRFVADRPGHDRRYAIDASKISEQLGFVPAIDFESGLRGTLQWYLRNRPWWQPLLERGL